MASSKSGLKFGGLRQWGALGLLCVTLPIVPIADVSQARSMPLSSGSVCMGAATLTLDHPDVQFLQSLIRQYGLNLPPTLVLDRPTMTRFELAQVLAWVSQQDVKFKPAEQERLGQLAERYQNLRSGRNFNRYQNQRLGLDRAGTSFNPKAAAPPIGVLASPIMPAPIAQPVPAGSIGMPAPANIRTNQMPIPGRMPNPMPQPEPKTDEPWRQPQQPGNTEGYSAIEENPFLRPASNPLSTFSIDVDTASYSNIRRMIAEGTKPPKDAVRLEEFINYFPYNYSQPQGDQPFSVNTGVTAAPWNPQHKLVRIGLQGKQLATPPPSNLVFLLDVSGSMDAPNKLPLLKQSVCLLVQQLSAQDQVSIVVYAGNAGLVLPPTSGDQKQKIMAAIDQIEAGGSTAGGEGIELAYKQAQTAFLKGGNNRVILATDGDFNVGPSSDGELVRMIEQKRDRGIFLTVLGFGTGNYKDSKMEQLADKGNGNYAYIDTLGEAKKVLGEDLRGTLFTIAKDVKIQVEFNPAKVQAYRLIGYENRALRDQDFNDDRKDAGEIGAGHRVTALYEIVPTGVNDLKIPTIDPLKYQKVDPKVAIAPTPSGSNELMQVKLRYKAPDGDTSKLITQPIVDQVSTADPDTQFAASVALFGMILRDSEYKGKAGIPDVLRLATAGQGDDRNGYRSEFMRIVKQYDRMGRDRNPL
jgi:Ca-activated chloride channel homolog